MAQEKTIVTDYPENGWLRGYFTTNESDILGGHQGATSFWKNTDFLRLRDTALHVLNPQPGQTILDVGCSDGATMIYCGLQGAEVYGQDLNPESVAGANKLLNRFNLKGEAVCGDAVELKFPDNHFDGVISSDFFEHITDDIKVKVLREISRVLKPGKPIVIKTPNLSYLKIALLYKRLRAVSRLRNPFKIVIPHTPGTDDPQHVGLVSRWQLTQCLYQAGFGNFHFFYAPLKRFGTSRFMEAISTEIPILRDKFCEDVFCIALKPIALAHFPD